MRLLLLFVLVPFLELFILLKLAEVISGRWTFAIVVVTGIVGATLARRQGWHVLGQLSTEVNAGKMPTTTLVDALMIFIAGALLITPGILTDIVGFSLLMPICRQVYRQVALKWFKRHVQVHAAVRRHSSNGEATASSSQVIDSYVVSRHDEE